MGSNRPTGHGGNISWCGTQGETSFSPFLNIGMTGCRVVYWLFAGRNAGDVNVSRRVQSRMQESQAERDKNNEEGSCSVSSHLYNCFFFFPIVSAKIRFEGKQDHNWYQSQDDVYLVCIKWKLMGVTSR